MYNNSQYLKPPKSSIKNKSHLHDWIKVYLCRRVFNLPLSMPTWRQAADVIRNEVNSQPGVNKVDKTDCYWISYGSFLSEIVTTGYMSSS